MKRIKATAEIRALKELIRYQRCKIIEFREENEKLREELIESKSKEGKGIMENLIEGISHALGALDFKSIAEKEIMKELNDNELEITGGENND